jgi:NSS family neurotransmitter:Na+ symporter
MPVALLTRAYHWPRPLATAVAAISCWALGLVSVLSFNNWADWYPLQSIPGLSQVGAFALLDGLTSNILLPAGGFALAVFGGWVVPERVLAEELQLRPRASAALRFLLRYVVPLGIAAATVAPLHLVRGAE